MASTDLEALQSALRTIKEVRSNTQDLWRSVAESKDDGQGNRETKYLSELKLKLDTIDSKIKELETTVNKPQSTVTIPLAHSLFLNTDTPSESVGLYDSLVTSYKFWGKAHDYSGSAASLLASQNNLHRSTFKVTKSRRRPTIPPPHSLDALINQIGNTYPDMKIRITRPNGTKSTAIVEVTLDRLLTASLIFKGLMIEWVMVRGFAEPVNSKDTRNDGTPDVWTESRYLVFRRITDNANAAMLNFQSPNYPELAAKSFFTYLHSFVTLFTDKCRNCGYHLHDNLPPTWREFKTLDGYHEDCRP